jgi:acetyl-CoA carboxylase biotin carboxyl carrier protein
MIDLEFVQQLIRTVAESSIDNVEIERGGTRIRVSKTPTGAAVQPSAPPHPVAGVPNAPGPSNSPHPSPGGVPGTGGPDEAPAASAVEDGWVEITSPMVGTFYRAPSPGADPFTDVGSRIAPGETLCIIEAMKLMNELEAEIEGTVREILVENGEPVEYGQVLFRVEPA